MTEVEIQMHKAILWEEACGKLRAMANVEGHRRLCEPMTVEHERACTEKWKAVDKAVEDFIAMMRDEGLCE